MPTSPSSSTPEPGSASKPPSSRLTRREAIKLLGGLSTGLLTGGYSATASGYPANETMQVGLIGCGGRMRALYGALQQIPGTRVTAVCDVFTDRLNSMHVNVGGMDRSVFKTGRHEELLSRPDIDAVIVATPDHWHVPITIEAVEAGKHVYLEKPATHKLEEGPRVIEAQKRTGKVIQVGAQQRNMPHLVVLKQKLDSGEIDPGHITRVHMQWCRNRGPYHRPNFRISPDQVDWKRFLGNAPEQPFDPFRMRTWRWIWDFGNGSLGDLMVHWLDATNWLLDLPMPSQVVMSGGQYWAAGHWETPDIVQCVMEYPELKMQMDFTCSFSNNYHKASVAMMGDRATVYFDRGRYEVIPQKPNPEPVAPVSDSVISGSGPRGKDFYDDYDGAGLHIGDWLESIRTNRKPADDIEAGVQAAAVAHHGNTSYLEGRVVRI